jgi:hypothetical protein
MDNMLKERSYQWNMKEVEGMDRNQMEENMGNSFLEEHKTDTHLLVGKGRS